MQLTYYYNHDGPFYIKQSQTEIYISSQNEKIWWISEIYQLKKIIDLFSLIELCKCDIY
jgi:hypothetical protein